VSRPYRHGHDDDLKFRVRSRALLLSHRDIRVTSCGDSVLVALSRALAIAFFYAIGTGIGGVGGPWLFGLLIDTGSRWSVFGGYLLGAALMIAAAAVAARFAVAAERKPLESVCRPLAAAD
jgi:MFS family permease